MKLKSKLLLFSTILFSSLSAFNTNNLFIANAQEQKFNHQNYKPEIGKYGGKLTVSSYTSPDNFNIYLTSNIGSINILGQMYVGLVTTDPITNQVKPELADSWTISADKKNYIVKMKKGLLWSDGKPITADDVIFTYNDIINNPNIPNNYRDGLLVADKFPEVSKVDDLTIKFVTSKPFVPFLRNGLSYPIVPKHILINTIKEDESEEIPFLTWWNLESDPKSIVCNGPFKLHSYIPDEEVILIRNDKYYRKDAIGEKLPYLDKLITKILIDSEEMKNYFVYGLTDIEIIRPKNYVELKTNKKIKLHNLGPDDGTLFVMFNQSTAKNEENKAVLNPIKSSWFRNTKFRQALAHAIDKQKMIKTIYKGLALPQISDISQQNPFYNPNVTIYNYDLNKAAKLLKNAGFKKNTKNELIDSKGNRVEFSLITNSGNPFRDESCKIIKADWAKLGINVTYIPTSFNSMVEQIDQTLDWEAMMVGLTGNSIDPYTGINSWKLEGRMHMFNMGNAKQNPEWEGRETSYEQWEKDVINLWEQASQEFDNEKRKKLYYKAQKIVSDNIPFLYTVNKQTFVGVKNNIGNIYPSLRGGNETNSVLWNSYELFIK